MNRTTLRFSGLALAALLISGCAGTKVDRVTHDSVIDLSGRWNDTDSRLVAEEMLRDCLNAPWLAAYTAQGTIELMPITDGTHYSFKCVNGHPGNGRYGLPTVMAMGALLDCDTGMIRLLSELTLTTALRTARRGTHG